MQESDPKALTKSLEAFKISKDFDCFNSNLNKFCEFVSPFTELSLSNNNKENINELQSKYKSELLQIQNQLENINLGHLDFAAFNKKIISKHIKDEDKEKSFLSKTINLDSNSKNNKTEKESVLSQHSIINSNSTLNNNIATLQTDSSFLSGYDENLIINNSKGKIFDFWL